MTNQKALLIAVFFGLSCERSSAEFNPPKQGQGYAQANTMGAGVAAIPESGKFRVFILAGQSNMTGSGHAADLKPPHNQRHERIRIWANGRWEFFVPKRKFGPGVSMAHQLAMRWPEDTIGIIKVAISGTGILSFQPDWSRTSANRTWDARKGNLYKDITNAVEAARKVSDFELTAFVWKQGGKDMKSLTLGKEYLSNFEKMLTSLRTELVAPELPAFVATYMTLDELETFNGLTSKIRPGASGVIRAHFEASEKLPHVVTFSHGKLPCRPDGIHFNTEGQLTLGRMYADAVERYYTPEEVEPE